MPPAYRFLDRWVVRATGDSPPPEPGKRNELLVKAYLPLPLKPHVGHAPR